MKAHIEREWNWSSINLPRPYYYRDLDVLGFGISWGNGNSDPVWRLGLHIDLRGTK